MLVGFIAIITSVAYWSTGNYVLFLISGDM